MERQVLFLKFWKRYDLVRISEDLGLKKGMVDTYLTQAYSKLRSFCLESPEFSRSPILPEADVPLAA